MSASARGAGAHTCRTITAFFPACLPCSITTTLPDFKLRGNRAMVRARRTQPPARGARHGAGASARGRASQPGVWAGRLAVGGQGGRAGGSLEQVGGRVTTHKRFDIAAVVCGSPPSLRKAEDCRLSCLIPRESNPARHMTASS